MAAFLLVADDGTKQSFSADEVRDLKNYILLLSAFERSAAAPGPPPPSSSAAAAAAAAAASEAAAAAAAAAGALLMLAKNLCCEHYDERARTRDASAAQGNKVCIGLGSEQRGWWLRA